MQTQVLRVQSSKVYDDHPINCNFDPPTLKWYSSESGDKSALC